MYFEGRYIRRTLEEKLIAVTDSISYKMIDKSVRHKYTFAFKTISAEEAERWINTNEDHCIGAVGHSEFAKDLNRILDINYHIPYGYGRERIHLTLREGDYVIVISRISNRASSYDKRKGYTNVFHKDDLMYTLAKVIKTPETSFDLCNLNENVTVLAC